ncbi:MAG: hypothetical protein JRN45_09215 [Nitrososphaerota archaeon]|nr:hypothetical protein [Nitrososphaerota archaeon]
MNENHRRVLAVYLNEIEKSIEIIRRELQPGAKEGDPVTYVIKRDMKDDSKVAILAGVPMMLNQTKSLMKLYDLSPQNESSVRNIRGALLGIRTTLYDLRPETLQGYGILTQKDKETFGAYVAKMFEILDRMDRVQA